MFRKGTTLVRKFIKEAKSENKRHVIIPMHCDIIRDQFWEENPEIIDLGKVSDYSSDCEFTYYTVNERATLEKSLKAKENSGS